MKQTAEGTRLAEAEARRADWKHWGPYVAERAWGTVREDYSASGDAWSFFPHEQARSRAYRWNEDGLGGFCNRFQNLCLGLALWNERDPFLKERLFGLNGHEGNHGEDVKEYYFYLDSTPTHSYLKWLYKYPQRTYPYRQLIEENRRREGRGREYELLDTGIFDDDRYFDVTVEYAKAAAEDIVLRITVENRGPEPAPIHLLPHLWFRNTWAWSEPPGPEPSIRPGPAGPGFVSLLADDRTATPPPNLLFEYRLGPRYLYVEDGGTLLFTDNETNAERASGPGAQRRKPYTKDAFHRQIINGEAATNPARQGTKSCVHCRYVVPAHGSVTLRLRLSPVRLEAPLYDVDAVLRLRQTEADEFYTAVQPAAASDDERLVQRQAFAGLLWTKQIYLFDVNQWLNGDAVHLPLPESRRHVRNTHWRHLNSMRILSMPDKWEFPWFAAWDLAFHVSPLALVDPEFAKEQLWFLLFEQFLHPSGQIPAYEWNFSDVNPPVHAWAVWRVYNLDRIRAGRADREFLEKCFHKLLLNFTWWVNKVDRQGNNIFEGGFLGLDNIAVADRSRPFPEGATLEQSDATGWMAMFCLNLMRIALELAKENRTYEGLATKFFQHYIYIAAAMKNMGGRRYQLWDEADGFFYDVLHFPDGRFEKFNVRSLVGLIPLYAVERLEEQWLAPFPEFRENLRWFQRNKQHLVGDVCHAVGQEGQRVSLLTIVDETQLRQLLHRLLDPAEFLSPFGVRSLSRHHEAHPFRFADQEVRYEPGEADVKLMGGNSNWRGPIWFPTTFLLIESLRKLGKAYGPAFTVPVAGGADAPATLGQVAEDLANRLIAIFIRDEAGRRPVHGDRRKFQDDPHWRGLILFHEYFHADTGEGLGASHQTGWTALVASLIDEWRRPIRVEK
ncbi:MAG: glucosidase [Chloroflexia bacterium]|nr:glucosidase [Chloroflexia bacterium]